jgi:hypothetical protein
LLTTAHRALQPAARQNFEWTGPDWIDKLPLHFKVINEMKDDEDPQRWMVGLFSFSLHRLNWDFRTHPEFRAYACGLMAYSGTPKELRTDQRWRRPEGDGERVVVGGPNLISPLAWIPIPHAGVP